MPCSGKTTLGKKLATHLNWEFIDTDRLIETLQPPSCREIYIKEGEKVFRSLEKQAIASLSGRSKCIIATGGGTLQEAENRRQLKTLGIIVYLKATPETLLKRLLSRPLPAMLDSRDPEKSWEALATKRIPLFEKVSDLIVDAEDPEIITKVCTYAMRHHCWSLI